MSARIVVQTGISSGSAHWIEKSVVRIGSHPSNDMVIPNPSVDHHMLTVEYRASGYRIYNRGSQQVFLGSRLVEPSQCSDWSDSDLLELPDGLVLALELDDDPRPSAKPIATRSQTLESNQRAELNADVGGPPTPSAGAGESNSKSSHERVSTSSQSPSPAISSAPQRTHSSSTAIQWGITGLCVVGCILLLVRHQIRSEGGQILPKPEFDSVIRMALNPESNVPAHVVGELQLAEAAFIRAQTKPARSAYRELHDTLVALQASAVVEFPSGPEADAPSPSDVHHSSDVLPALRELVEYRLRQLAE